MITDVVTRVASSNYKWDLAKVEEIFKEKGLNLNPTALEYIILGGVGDSESLFDTWDKAVDSLVHRIVSTCADNILKLQEGNKESNSDGEEK